MNEGPTNRLPPFRLLAPLFWITVFGAVALPGAVTGGDEVLLVPLAFVAATGSVFSLWIASRPR